MSEGKAVVTSYRVVVRDGWYNGMTDLALWKNYYWLTYRRSTGHVSSLNVLDDNEFGGLQVPNTYGGNSFVVLLRSTDLLRWHEAEVFTPPDGVVDKSGIANGHFCVTDNRLYAFTPVQTPTDNGVFGRLYCTWTENGVKWTEPEIVKMGETYPYTFRVRNYDNKFYSAITCDQSLLLITSKDGKNWELHSEIASEHPKQFTEETELYWLRNGELWCVVRSSNSALFYQSKPPYTEWSGTDLGVRCDAPVICSTKDKVYLAGRVEGPGEIPGVLGAGTTGIYELTSGKTELLLTFPPGADAAYVGLVSPSPGKLVLSTYSDHAYYSDSIKPKYFPEYVYKKSECDIYIAEIELRD